MYGLKPDVDYINGKQKNWCKLSEELVSEKRNDIDWDNKLNPLGINEIWEKLNRN